MQNDVFGLSVCKAITSSRFLTQKVSELNLTLVQAMVLGFLNYEDQITSGELGKRTELRQCDTDGIFNRLEAAGFIERKKQSR